MGENQNDDGQEDATLEQYVVLQIVMIHTHQSDHCLYQAQHQCKQQMKTNPL
jgi:hypothetical protein